ncbi:MAG TPA: N-acetylmuramoyl-L-alanine amidase, partial [Firmicutes bacterium]|nr:N-acetylmuramoyl-L-alanine amidase [Bacillota bacterium]
IVVENDSQGRTRLVIEENQILAVEIRQSGSTLQISFLHPKEVYDKILVLDAGHGLNDPGTNGHGMVEKDVNLDILLRTQALFEANSDIKVYVTRDDDSYPTNVSRAQMANETADLFVSIHQNAATSTSANGIEVLYMNHASDTGNGRLTSQIAAQFMQNYMVSATGLSDRGIKIRSDLIVLNQTKVPAILIECGFLSNDTDAAALSQSATRDAIANAIYSAVTDMFNQYNYR